MKNMRRWQLEEGEPYAIQLAADARISKTDYLDDQVWNVKIGTGESPALALQSKYGGRVGLASIVPMWTVEGKLLYQPKDYSQAPVITHFAPGYQCVSGTILPDVVIRFDFWAMTSHAVGCVVTVENKTEKTVTLHLDLFGHVGKEKASQALNIITLPRKGHALHMGSFNNLNPVVQMEGASASLSDGRADSPKIGRTLDVAGKKSVSVRWIHVGLPEIAQSVNYAKDWLKQDWNAYLKQIDEYAMQIPDVRTGNRQWDLVLASAYQQAVGTVLNATSYLPNSSFVATRKPESGYSFQQDGTDYPRSWAGQNPTLAYLLAPVLASVKPELGQGIVENYLAVQQDDGWIDWKPGLAGQRFGSLCLPNLARMTWNVYQETEDAAFLERNFQKLFRFLSRWLDEPHWQNERQTGYVALPTFGEGRVWAQGADIRTFETPDMYAYLLSETASLIQIAIMLEMKSHIAKLQKIHQTLLDKLNQLWDGDRFTYQDRATHGHGKASMILNKADGDFIHEPDITFQNPQRLLVKIVGGVNHIPNITLHIEGFDTKGNPIHEFRPADDFVWGNRQGVLTSNNVFAQVTKIHCEGLSRVYKLTVKTIDYTHLDINALLPLWSNSLSEEQTEKIVNLILDREHFWRANGVSMNSAQDINFDSSNAMGSGGVWVYWLTLIGEGLVDSGSATKADDLVKQLLNLQVNLLTETHQFPLFYDSDQPNGIGEKGHLAGLPPLHLFHRLIGIRIMNPGKVWTGGEFGWDRTIQVKQHGVTVNRSKKNIEIRFPSGTKLELDGDAPWQEIIDPNSDSHGKKRKPVLNQPNKPPKLSPSLGKVVIDVQVED